MKVTGVKVTFQEGDASGEIALSLEEFAKLFVVTGAGPFPCSLITVAEHDRMMTDLEERIRARAAKP
jgi:hypothetical protein